MASKNEDNKKKHNSNRNKLIQNEKTKKCWCKKCSGDVHVILFKENIKTIFLFKCANVWV